MLSSLVILKLILLTTRSFRKYNLLRHELSHTHGRRKPKEGLPTPIPRILEQRERLRDHHNGDGGNNGTASTDEDDTCSNSGNNTYSEEYSTSSQDYYHQPLQDASGSRHFAYHTVSKSDLYAVLFGNDDDSYDGISPVPKQKYRVLKFENY